MTQPTEKRKAQAFTSRTPTLSPSSKLANRAMSGARGRRAPHPLQKELNIVPRADYADLRPRPPARWELPAGDPAAERARAGLVHLVHPPSRRRAASSPGGGGAAGGGAARRTGRRRGGRRRGSSGGAEAGARRATARLAGRGPAGALRAAARLVGRGGSAAGGGAARRAGRKRGGRRRGSSGGRRRVRGGRRRGSPDGAWRGRGGRRRGSSGGAEARRAAAWPAGRGRRGRGGRRRGWPDVDGTGGGAASGGAARRTGPAGRGGRRRGSPHGARRGAASGGAARRTGTGGGAASGGAARRTGPGGGAAGDGAARRTGPGGGAAGGGAAHRTGRRLGGQRRGAGSPDGDWRGGGPPGGARRAAYCAARRGAALHAALTALWSRGERLDGSTDEHGYTVFHYAGAGLETTVPLEEVLAACPDPAAALAVPDPLGAPLRTPAPPRADGHPGQDLEENCCLHVGRLGAGEGPALLSALLRRCPRRTGGPPRAGPRGFFPAFGFGAGGAGPLAGPSSSSVNWTPPAAPRPATPRPPPRPALSRRRLQIHAAVAAGRRVGVLLAAMLAAPQARAALALQDRAGSTPLHTACRLGRVEVARALLEAGAPAGPDAPRDRQGLLPGEAGPERARRLVRLWLAGARGADLGAAELEGPRVHRVSALRPPSRTGLASDSCPSDDPDILS
eukprot:tig00020830_g14454.t1